MSRDSISNGIKHLHHKPTERELLYLHTATEEDNNFTFFFKLLENVSSMLVFLEFYYKVTVSSLHDVFALGFCEIKSINAMNQTQLNTYYTFRLTMFCKNAIDDGKIKYTLVVQSIGKYIYNTALSRILKFTHAIISFPHDRCPCHLLLVRSTIRGLLPFCTTGSHYYTNFRWSSFRLCCSSGYL